MLAVGSSSGCRLENEDEALIAQLEFEQTFASSADPWSYASDYEQRKYDQTLALVPAGAERALEIGCAEGFFTAKLAERVTSVLACDISTIALSRAARRCGHLGNVAFMRLDAFNEELPAGYDLIVCSEALYYVSSEEQLDRVLQAIARALQPGGCLLTANAHALVDDATVAGFDWDVPLGGRRIGEAILATGLFELARETRTEPYRIQAFVRRARRRAPLLRLGRRTPPPLFAAAGEMTRAASSCYASAPRLAGSRSEGEGGEDEPTATADQQLPILMYHRVAADGSPRTQRWRLDARTFAQQLSFLREAGYYSVSFEQWRAAASMRRPLPGKPIILTFDDGYEDFATEAMPLLRDYGFRATVFVVSELVGRSNLWDADLGESLSLMDWATIERLAVEGVDFGSHSLRHRPLVTLGREQLAEDLARSRRTLEEHVGHPVTTLSYPFGLVDTAVQSIAGACGYEYGVTTSERRSAWSDSLLLLPRLEVRGTDTLEKFAGMFT